MVALHRAHVQCKAVLATVTFFNLPPRNCLAVGLREGDPCLTSPARSQVVMLPAKANSTITNSAKPQLDGVNLISSLAKRPGEQ
jgi:hypothetical protein